MVVGQWAVERDAGAERLDGLVARMGKSRRRLEADSRSPIAEGEVGRMVELQRRGQIEARARTIPHTLALTCALARAGVKSMPVPSDPAVPTAVMVTVSWFAGVPTVSLSPTAKPFTLRTLILVAPALASAERFVWLACRADLRDGDGLDSMADAVDVQPDLVTDRDVGDGRHLDVGRAGSARPLAR